MASADPPSSECWWRLVCPVCYRVVPGELLVDQLWWLVRHLRAAHAYEAIVLTILLEADPGPVDPWLDVEPGRG